LGEHSSVSLVLLTPTAFVSSKSIPNQFSKNSKSLYFSHCSAGCSCGYSIAQQDALFHSLKPSFMNKPLLIVCNKTDLVSMETLSDEDLKLIEEMKAEAMKAEMGSDEEAVLFNTEEGVMSVKNAACQRLLDKSVEAKMKSKNINQHLNRLHVAMPKLRDDKERLPCIPQGAVENEKRKTEKDLEDGNGGAGVYSASLKKNYILADKEWKNDIIPEICDGHNVADFVDPDILNRLEELESEEDLREAEDEEDDFEIEGETLTEEQKNQLADIRKKKVFLIREHRLKKSNAQNRATVRGKFDKDKKFTRERLGRELSSLGLDPSSAMNRKKKKLCLRSRSRSVSRPPHEVLPGEGFKDSCQKMRAIMIGNKSHRKRNKDARRGEADRVILSLKPKHLFSGKRGKGREYADVERIEEYLSRF
ncbi:unnamed protein product, partial [Thlaspi arvense]